MLEELVEAIKSGGLMKTAIELEKVEKDKLIKYRDGASNSILQIAVEANNADIVDIVLSACGRELIDVVNGQKSTVLHMAIEPRIIKTISRWFDLYAKNSFKVKDMYGMNAVHRMLEANRDPESIISILKNHPELLTELTGQGESVLHLTRNIDVAKHIAENAPEEIIYKVTYAFPSGTALHSLVMLDKLEIAELLIKRFPKLIYMKNKDGRTALELVVNPQNKLIIQEAINKANIEQKNNEIERLKNTIDQQKANEEQNSSEIERLKKIIAQQEIAQEQVRKKYKELKSKNESLDKKMLTDQQNQAKNFSIAYNKLNLEKEQFKKALDDARDTNKVVVSRKKEVLNENKELKSENEQLKKALNAERDTNKVVAIQKNEVLNENKELKEKIAGVNKQHEEKIDRVKKEYQETMANLGTRNYEFKQKTIELNKLNESNKQEIADLNKKVVITENNAKESAKTIEELNINIQKLEEEKTNLVAAVEHLQQNVSELETKLTNAPQYDMPSFEEAAEKVDILYSKNAEIAMLKKELAILNEELAISNKECEKALSIFEAALNEPIPTILTDNSMVDTLGSNIESVD